MGETGRLTKLLNTFKNNAHDVDWRALFNLRLLGFSLNRAWVYLLFLGIGTSAMTWNGQPAPDITFMVSTIALCCTLFCAAGFSMAASRLLHRPGVRYAGPLLTALGTALLATSTIEGAPQMLLACIAGVTTGVGSGVIDMGYGRLYRDVDSRHTCLEAPLAFLLAAVVFFLTGDLASPVVSCLITMLLPLVSGGILFLYYDVWSASHEPTVRPVPMSAWRFALRVGACACLVGAADGAVRSVFMAANGVGASEFYHVPLVIASLITLALIWLCVLFSESFDLRGIYKFAVLIMAFFFQLLPIFVGTPLEHVLALAGYGTFNVLVWILLADITHTYRVDTFKVFGIGWGMITFGVFIGSLLGAFLCDVLAPFSPQALTSVALISTIAVLLSYMFVLKESDMVELTTIGELEEQTSDSAQAVAAGHGVHRQASSAGSVPGAAAQEAVTDADGMLLALDAGIASTAPGTHGERAMPDAEFKPRFVSRCNKVAQEYGLSEREAQIMILYAKGRSYARIQEELFISRGTLTTHLRHIYQKMDVHNKQELLDLIEERRD